jgi:hypothetical protein
MYGDLSEYVKLARLLLIVLAIIESKATQAQVTDESIVEVITQLPFCCLGSMIQPSPRQPRFEFRLMISVAGCHESGKSMTVTFCGGMSKPSRSHRVSQD